MDLLIIIIVLFQSLISNVETLENMKEEFWFQIHSFSSYAIYDLLNFYKSELLIADV